MYHGKGSEKRNILLDIFLIARFYDLQLFPRIVIHPPMYFLVFLRTQNNATRGRKSLNQFYVHILCSLSLINLMYRRCHRIHPRT